MLQRCPCNSAEQLGQNMDASLWVLFAAALGSAGGASAVFGSIELMACLVARIESQREAKCHAGRCTGVQERIPAVLGSRFMSTLDHQIAGQ